MAADQAINYSSSRSLLELFKCLERILSIQNTFSSLHGSLASVRSSKNTKYGIGLNNKGKLCQDI